MTKRVREAVQKCLREAGCTGHAGMVLCAVSGGADSVCMLHVLCELQQDTGFDLCCVHVHHGIRGKEADEDAAFVRSICEAWQVPFVLKEADVPALAKQSSHTGIEESARHARYEALREVAEGLRGQQDTDMEAAAKNGKGTTQGSVWIAVAHTLDDNAETVLFQLFRGTGLRGLSGIRETNKTVIRPLLNVSRKEIEAYLNANGIAWRTDHTNEDKTYARNRIRHAVLPEAEAYINTGVKEHIANTARNVREALRFLDTCVTEAQARCVATCTEDVYKDKREALAFSVKALLKEDPFLRSELVLKALTRLQETAGKGSYYQIGRVHVEAVLRLCESENGRAHLDLPGDVRAERLHDNLILFLF